MGEGEGHRSTPPYFQCGGTSQFCPPRSCSPSQGTGSLSFHRQTRWYCGSDVQSCGSEAFPRALRAFNGGPSSFLAPQGCDPHDTPRCTDFMESPATEDTAVPSSADRHPQHKANAVTAGTDRLLSRAGPKAGRALTQPSFGLLSGSGWRHAGKVTRVCMAHRHLCCTCPVHAEGCQTSTREQSLFLCTCSQ